MCLKKMKKEVLMGMVRYVANKFFYMLVSLYV
jgi:hypothetical protein